MKKAVILLMLILWVIVTSLVQSDEVEQSKPDIINSLDNLSRSLDSLNKVIDEKGI